MIEKSLCPTSKLNNLNNQRTPSLHVAFVFGNRKQGTDRSSVEGSDCRDESPALSDSDDSSDSRLESSTLSDRNEACHQSQHPVRLARSKTVTSSIRAVFQRRHLRRKKES
jgi:hypothetical protein